MVNDITIIVPTLNAGELWNQWVAVYNKLDKKPECLVIDSASTDETVNIARSNGMTVKVIDRSAFDHGGTRNIALSLTTSRYVIYMTQDALFAGGDSIDKIMRPFEDSSVSAVYGRQMQRPDADVFERYSRLRNYPDVSYIRSYDDRVKFGIKTAFMSNSFAAYRRDVLESVGGFPCHQIFGEDMYVAAKMLQAGWRVAYASEAAVIHSHDYSAIQEFRRYFDMGVFHAREPWIRRDFGKVEKEGMKFVLSELNYLLKHAFWRIPEGLFRTVLRYIGFRLGLEERHIPLNIKRKISMNSGYFKIE